MQGLCKAEAVVEFGPVQHLRPLEARGYIDTSI